MSRIPAGPSRGQGGLKVLQLLSTSGGVGVNAEPVNGLRAVPKSNATDG